MFVSDILLEYTLLNPKVVCRSNMSGHQVQNVSRSDLLIVVTSSPENFERRKLIRESWAASPLVISGHVKVIFMLGLKVNMSESDREAIKEGYQDKYLVYVRDSDTNITLSYNLY